MIHLFADPIIIVWWAAGAMMAIGTALVHKKLSSTVPKLATLTVPMLSLPPVLFYFMRSMAPVIAFSWLRDQLLSAGVRRAFARSSCGTRQFDTLALVRR